MDTHVVTRVTALVLVLLAAACGPTIRPCSPETCAGGCCDSSGVCVAGRNVMTCGLGGSACVVCGSTQSCTTGQCEDLTGDAGIDAGTVDAGGLDSGIVDAGRVRTVTLTRTTETLAADGGTLQLAASLLSTQLTLSYEDATGTWVSIQPQDPGTSAVFEGVPEGLYVIQYKQRTATVINLVVSDSDDINIGLKNSGRNAPALVTPTRLTVDASVPDSWVQGDFLTATSLSAGMTKDSFTTTRTGALSISATGDLSIAAQAFAVQPGDDLTLTLNRNMTDAGGPFVTAAWSGVTISSPMIGQAQSVTITPTLTVLPRDSARLTIRASDFAQFATDVNPSATVFSHRVLVYANATGPGTTGGGDFDGRGAILLNMSRNGETDVSADVSWGNPFQGRAPFTTFRAFSTELVQFSYQGKTASRSLDAFTTTRLASAVSSLGPEMSPPRFVTINGETAFINRNGVSTTPVFEWVAPALGTPTRYSMQLFKIAVQGTTLNFTLAAELITPTTRVRFPPEVLTQGEAYVAYVTAANVKNNDVRRTPNRVSRETEDATAVTNVFTP